MNLPNRAATLPRASRTRRARRPALIAASAAAIAASAAAMAASAAAVSLLLAGCGGLSPSRAPRARLDPPPGTYSEAIRVSPRDEDERYYWSGDPAARLGDFTPMETPVWIEGDSTFRYFAIGSGGLRSPIIEAVYVIEDTRAPVIVDPHVWQAAAGYYSFEIRWTAIAPGEAGSGDPTDEVTTWQNLEYAVYSSRADDIGSIAEAEANGRFEAGWVAGMRSYVYRAERPGTGRFFNVFVRDLSGNATAYGTRRFATRPVLSIYLGFEDALVDDLLHVNAGSPDYYPKFTTTNSFAWGTTIAVDLARVDADALDDLAIVQRAGGTDYYRWYRARPDATFDPANPVATVHSEPASARPSTMRLVDLTGDGTRDLVYTTSAAVVRVSNSAGDLVGEFGSGVDRFAVGDLDRDGRTDVVTVGATTGQQSVRVWRNNGGGAFAEITQSWTLPTGKPLDVELADLDRDGTLDLILVVEGEVPNVKLYYGDGSGRFAAGTDETAFWGTDGATRGVAVADFDADGFPDLFFSNAIPPSRVYLNNRDRTFVAGPGTGSTSAASGAIAVDLNGNGTPEIVEHHVNEVLVWIYSGTGFDPTPLVFAGTSPRHIAIGQVR